MTTQIIDKYVYSADGKLVEKTTVEVPVVTEADIIAEKEAALLAMYEELQALKQSQQS